MPELRKDPILGRWVIVATDRARRPSDFITEPQPIQEGVCPFCEGYENMTPPEIAAYREKGSNPNEKGWRIRVVPNKYPALRIEGALDKKGIGLYDWMNGIGAHEVIIESPRHEISLSTLTDANVREIIWAYHDRMVDLKKDPRFKYGMIFKNVGQAAGASLEHTHSQLIVLPTIPKTINEEMSGSLDFYNYRGRCIYCDIIRQESDTQNRLVMEGEQYIAFCPFAPRFPFETWIIPKNHQSHFEMIQKEGIEELASILKGVLAKIETGLGIPPYNYMVHTAPFNTGDLEHYHWHIEIIPRLTRVAGFEWGTGFYINPVPPESAAQFLREQEIPEPQPVSTAAG